MKTFWKIVGVLYIIYAFIVFFNGGSGGTPNSRYYDPGDYYDDEPVQSNQYDDVYYENCDDARAQGADPVYSDDPGYRSALDRDGDGVGCEQW